MTGQPKDIQEENDSSDCVEINISDLKEFLSNSEKSKDDEKNINSGVRILIIFVLIIVVYLLSILYYRYNFGSYISSNQKDWGTFSAYISAISTTIIGFATPYIGYLITKKITENEKKSKQYANLRELDQQFYSYDYYIRIIAVMWEIYCKWKGQGDVNHYEYRKSLLLGKFWHENKSINSNYNNEIRKRDHFQSFDALTEKNIVNDHMILTMWYALWERIQEEMKEGEIDIVQTRLRLAKFYEYYVDLHQQIWLVANIIEKASEQGHGVSAEIDMKNHQEYDFAFLDQKFEFDDRWKDNLSFAQEIARNFINTRNGAQIKFIVEPTSDPGR